MTQPMIELEDVAKSFDGGITHAVESVSLVIEEGGFVALVGGSGSGKTTTLKMINGLIRPSRGRIRVGGEAVGDVAPHLLRRRIGYVFQEVGLFPHLSVAENIGITPKLMGEPKAAIEARVAELLDLVSLPREFAARRPAELSGGPAAAGGGGPRSGRAAEADADGRAVRALDPVTRDALGAEYRQLHERLGLTTLMVTHDITEAVLLADRIVVMDKGQVRAEANRPNCSPRPTPRCAR